MVDHAGRIIQYGGGASTAQITLTPTTIVGNSAGSLAHAAGVTAIAAPGAGKLLVLVNALLVYTRTTASYGAGDAVNLAYFQGGARIQDICASNTAAGTFADANSGNSTIFMPFNVIGIADLNTTFTNASIGIYTGVAFTNPGTAAGTATLTLTYFTTTVS